MLHHLEFCANDGTSTCEKCAIRLGFDILAHESNQEMAHFFPFSKARTQRYRTGDSYVGNRRIRIMVCRKTVLAQINIF